MSVPLEQRPHSTEGGACSHASGATDRISTYAVTLPLTPTVDHQPYFGGTLGGMDMPSPQTGQAAATNASVT